MTRPVLILLVGAIALLYLYHYSSGLRAWLRQMSRRLSSGLDSGTTRRATGIAKPDAAAQAALEAFERFTQEVNALSVEEAKRRAAPMVADDCLWRGEGGPTGEEEQNLLGPTLREIAARYARLELLDGEMRLRFVEMPPASPPQADALSFGEQAARRRFYRIGEDLDGNVVVVERGKDTLYIVHRTTTLNQRTWTTTYPSLYHWLLIKRSGLPGQKPEG